MKNTATLTIKYLETKYDASPDFDFDDSGALVYEFTILDDDVDGTFVCGVVHIFDENINLNVSIFQDDVLEDEDTFHIEKFEQLKIALQFYTPKI